MQDKTIRSRQGASTQYAGKTSEGEKVLSGGQSTMPTQGKGYRGYRDLKVYQLSYQLALEIHELTKQFPKEEKYALTDQIRKSSRSVPANLAEAWKKRRYKKAFISKLTDSAGEAGETEVWLDFSNDFRYINAATHTDLLAKYDEVNRMLYGMIDKAEKFTS